MIQLNCAPDVVKVRRHEGYGAVRAGLEELPETRGEQRLSVDGGSPLAELVDEEEGARGGGAHRQGHLVHVHHEGRQAQRHRLDGLDAGANLGIRGGETFPMDILLQKVQKCYVSQ